LVLVFRVAQVVIHVMVMSLQVVVADRQPLQLVLVALALDQLEQLRLEIQTIMACLVVNKYLAQVQAAKMVQAPLVEMVQDRTALVVEVEMVFQVAAVDLLVLVVVVVPVLAVMVVLV
jgi:hypothetical protein